MQNKELELEALEELREAGDYARLAKALPKHWDDRNSLDVETMRMRMLAAEIYGREGRLEQMADALEPYLGNLDNIPFGYAPRALILASIYHNRDGDGEKALRLASTARTVAEARNDESTAAEAILAEGKAFWSLNRWEESVKRYEEAIALYSAQSRSYRLGLAYMSLGGVLARVGKVEDARTALERAIRIMLKFRDEFSLAVARVDIVLALNAMGEYETSLKYLQFAQEAFDQIGHETYRLMTLTKTAEVLLLLKDYDRAQSYISRALEMAMASMSSGISSLYDVKGRLSIARSEFDKAEKALRTAVDLAEQAGSHIQRAEARRSLGKLYLAQNRTAEAATILRDGIDDAIHIHARLLELEMKALLSEAIYGTAPVEACKLISEVESESEDRNLPELKKVSQAARRQIDSLDHEHYFIISDARMPTLAEARVAMLKWLWARALYRAKGNAREAAEQLDVTPTYIRKLTKLIPRDLLRPGRKRPKRRRSSAASV
jgi:tetratricopeptide (TPR) repeat protein